MPWLPVVPADLVGPREKLFVYVLDESGDAQRGMVIGGLRFPFHAWNAAQQGWQEFCLACYADPLLGLRMGEPLHAVELGRGADLPPDQLAARRGLIPAGLRVVRALREVTPVAYYRPGATREALYAALVPTINSRHEEDGSKGIVYFDGNGSEKRLWAPHQALKVRHIDGPNLRPDHDMPLLQAADFVVHAAYHFLARKPGREDLWDLFPTLLPQAEGPELL
ncbi:DUF3800 domain-containing protein [Streptomyces sp. NBC_00249]|uniref:DUF3800 domain-containing protein n=1 Tax=Streptomyces sp. NBC_00249 TaxID=2975690 RepID=UPI00224E97C5|nr:DUF3800 domain-containing protein [Streptomyces sp. NBC_00249]MCX5199044.1 DUF3800 domain-containing protein [Streptomyces sp. NBC_00249]